MNDRVTISVKNHIATVTMMRQDKMNAMDGDMFEALANAGETLKLNEDVRVVILTGGEDNFSAGIDTATLPEMIARIDELRAQMLELPEGEIANPFQKTCYVWQELAVPVIAAINGVAYGAGAQLALAADFRIAAPDLRLSIMESKWGLIPDMGISQNLPKLIRADQAKELMMTGRTLDASEALAMGLVSRLSDDPIKAAQDFAETLITRSPQVLRGAKQLVDDGWTPPAAIGLKLEAMLQSQIIATPNQIEAVVANIQKRPPNFK